MLRELIVTKDGSQSISVPELNVTYHSIHGAITESKHVFIEAGLNYILSSRQGKSLNIFEMGFGTGLNAFLTYLVSETKKIPIFYETIETNPLQPGEYLALEYASILSPENTSIFKSLHTCTWNEEHNISTFFAFKKNLCSLLSYTTHIKFDLVFFDAFAPLAQPELWTQQIFEQLHSITNPNGCLITYCSKGDVRRAMIAAGFQVEKLKGPPGKREMIRACV